MLKKLLIGSAAIAGLAALATTIQAQPAPAPAAPAAPATPPAPGTIVLGAPQDIFLTVTTGPNGAPVVDTPEFVLNLGGYYRMNFVCPDARNDDTGFHFEAPELMLNIHLRVISVADIEIYMQGATFRAIECDEVGAARFSFHPMRRGVYEIEVRDHLDPPQQAFVQVVVE